MSNNLFLTKIDNFIKENDLLHRDKNHLLALSGGIDSVCLFHVLRLLNYKFEVSHCNFHLRGKDSDNDELFCKSLCQQYHIPFHSIAFDTIAYAQHNHLSIEMAARDLRYDYFKKTSEKLNIGAVCLAHHINDNVETILLNLCRGTGLKGLHGIKAKRDIYVRPLLCVTRDEIVSFISSSGYDYCQDLTNSDVEIARNRIRHNVIPNLISINSAAIHNIDRTSKLISIAEQHINDSVKIDDIVSKKEPVQIAMSLFSDVYIVYHILSNYGYNYAQSKLIYDAILNKNIGKIFYSTLYKLLIDRQDVIIEKLNKKDNINIEIIEPGEIVISEKIKLKIKQCSIEEIETLKSDKHTCFVDKDAVSFPLKVRNITAGDKFIPFGMKHNKLISDYLTDRKVNVFDKQNQLILTDSNDKPIWLIEERVDERMRVTAKTKNVLIISSEHC